VKEPRDPAEYISVTMMALAVVIFIGLLAKAISES